MRVAIDREQLTSVVRLQATGRDVCDQACTYLLEFELRKRLSVLGVEPTPELAVAMMATAMLLAEEAPEFGGDCRDALGELAQLGLALLDEG